MHGLLDTLFRLDPTRLWGRSIARITRGGGEC